MDKDSGIRKIASIEKAALLIDCFDVHHKELSLNQLAQKTGYPKTTVYGIAATLVSVGLLAQSPNSSNYSLGTKLMELAYNTRMSQPIIQIAAPMLNRISKQSEQNVYLTTHRNGRLLYLASCYRTWEYIGYSEAGKTLPMHCTASGKAMLAHMTDEQVDAVLSAQPMEKSAPNTITEPGILKKELLDIRKQGFAVDNEEETAGVKCIAVAILSDANVPVGAISISGSVANVTATKVYEYYAMLVESMPILKLNAGYFPYSFL
jgi:DNA-binding IclR family transcriptional regulator